METLSRGPHLGKSPLPRGVCQVHSDPVCTEGTLWSLPVPSHSSLGFGGPAGQSSGTRGLTGSSTSSCSLGKEATIPRGVG